MNGVIYARYSCDKQTENSILGQVRECSDFAKRNNIDIIGIYKDEAISGRTAEKRPSFLKMIHDASMHIFDCVIVWKGDRFSRSRADAARYKSELKKLGIAVLSATEANVTGPEAILMDGINEAFAEYFSVELAAKVERGMTQNAIDGKFNGGALPPGYKKDQNGKIIVDELVGPMIKELFNLYVNSDKTIQDLVNMLNEKGYTNYFGRPFSNSGINRMIKNPRYIGHYEFKGTVNNNIFPALVDEDTWKAAQLKALKNKHERQKYESRDIYLLSHKVFCGECDNLMTGHSCKSKSKKKFRYYKCTEGKPGTLFCKKTINKYDLEDAVIDYLIQFIFNNTRIDHLIMDVLGYLADETTDLTTLQKLIKNTDRKISNITDAIAEGADRALLIPKLNELKNLKEKQTNELKSLQCNNGVITKDYIETFLRGLKLKDYLSIESKQYLIDTLVKRIYVYDSDEFEIYLNYNGIGAENSVMKGVCLTRRSVHHTKFHTLLLLSSSSSK